MLSYQGNSSWKREEGDRGCSATKGTGVREWEDLASDSHSEHGWRFAGKGRSSGESQWATGGPAVFIFIFALLVLIQTSMTLRRCERVVWKGTSLCTMVPYLFENLLSFLSSAFLLCPEDIMPRTLVMPMNSVLWSVITKIGQHSKFGFWAHAGRVVIYFGREGQAGGTTRDLRERNGLSEEKSWWL